MSEHTLRKIINIKNAWHNINEKLYKRVENLENDIHILSLSMMSSVRWRTDVQGSSSVDEGENDARSYKFYSRVW